jgi:hypothetical protein
LGYFRIERFIGGSGIRYHIVTYSLGFITIDLE